MTFQAIMLAKQGMLLHFSRLHACKAYTVNHSKNESVEQSFRFEDGQYLHVQCTEKRKLAKLSLITTERKFFKIWETVQTSVTL